jgi:hypothetical protein
MEYSKFNKNPKNHSKNHEQIRNSMDHIRQFSFNKKQTIDRMSSVSNQYTIYVNVDSQQKYEENVSEV